MSYWYIDTKEFIQENIHKLPMKIRKGNESIYAMLLCLCFVTVHSFAPPLKYKRNIAYNIVTPNFQIKALIRNEEDREMDPDMDITELERRVYQDARERLDLQALSIVSSADDEYDPEIFEEVSNPIKVAIAAGGLSFITAFYLFNNVFVALACFAAVSAFASWDPLEEQSPAGAAARVVGRGVIRATKKTQPRITAVANAAVKGVSEIRDLERRVEDLENEVADLEEENAELRRIVEIQQVVEMNLGKFSLDELKYVAQKNGIPHTGTKSRLLKRLVEENAINLP